MILKNEILSVYQQLLAGGELRHIEAKKASGGVGDSIMQTFCAFSNHQSSGANTQTSGVKMLPDDRLKATIIVHKKTKKIIIYRYIPNPPEQAYIITALGRQWLVALDCNETDL